MSSAESPGAPSEEVRAVPGNSQDAAAGDGLLLRLVATGLRELAETSIDSQREDLRGLSRPSGAYSGPYPPKAQAAYNHVVLHCLATDVAPPRSLPDLVRWAARIPVGDWPLPLPDAAAGSPAFLVDDATRTPTLECLEWTVDGADPLARLHEAQLMTEVLHTCRRLRLQETYEAFRRLVIEQPVLLASEHARLGRDPDLAPLDQVPKQAYEPVPATRAVDGALPLCAGCGCVLHRVRGRWYCELDACRGRGPAVLGRALPLQGESALQVVRPLRTFVTGPGLAEISLLKATRALGLKVELWPGIDMYDLRITLPDGQAWAIDVKDWSNPALLGRWTSWPPQDAATVYDKAFIVVPRYRLERDRDYRARYRRARRTTGQAEPPPLLSEDELLKRLASFAAPSSGCAAPAVGQEDIDA